MKQDNTTEDKLGKEAEQEQLEVEMMDLLIYANKYDLLAASDWISHSFGWDDIRLD